MSASLVQIVAAGDVRAAVERVTLPLHDGGVPGPAFIEHGAGARAAGLSLPDEVVIVFGNPAVGTPVMQADPRAGIDLPLRILVWSAAGTTRVAYRDPRRLAGHFRLGPATETLARLSELMEQLARAAATVG